MRKLKYLAVLTTAVLLMAACGGSDDSDEGGQGASTSSSQDELIPVRFVRSPATMAGLDIAVARGAGLFEREGVEYVDEDLELSAANLIALAVATDETDVANGGATGVYAAVQAGQDLMVASVSNTGPTMMVTVSRQANDRLEQAGVTAESPIRDRLEALQGLSITTTSAGGVVETFLRSLFEDFDLEPPSFEAVTDAGAQVSGVSRGDLDAIATSPPSAVIPTINSDAVAWITPEDNADIPSWAENPYSVNMMRRSVATDHPEMVQRVRAALSAAHEMIQNDPEAAMEAARSFYPDLEDAMFEASFEIVRPVFKGIDVSEGGFEASLTAFNATADAPLPADTALADLYYTE